MRLALLDQAGDNDYFKMGYKKYEREEWGKGIWMKDGGKEEKVFA